MVEFQKYTFLILHLFVIIFWEKMFGKFIFSTNKLIFEPKYDDKVLQGPSNTGLSNKTKLQTLLKPPQKARTLNLLVCQK